MKIRPEQMAAFAADRFEELVADACAFVRTRFPQVAYRATPTDLDARVREHLAEATRLGFATERGALRYLDYRLTFGDSLWTAPRWAWVRDILLDPKLSEADKIARIEHLAYGAPAPDGAPS